MTEETPEVPYIDLRDLSHNPDASAWAAAFKSMFPDSDEGLMLAWFANAMMAMHDYLECGRYELANEVVYALGAEVGYTIDAGDDPYHKRLKVNFTDQADRDRFAKAIEDLRVANGRKQPDAG